MVRCFRGFTPWLLGNIIPWSRVRQNIIYSILWSRSGSRHDDQEAKREKGKVVAQCLLGRHTDFRQVFTSISPLRDTLDDLTSCYYTPSPKGPITLGYNQAFDTWGVKHI